MKKLLKKYEMQILKGLLLVTVIGSIVFTVVETKKSMEEWNNYQQQFQENLNNL